jgi:hypothetical protein
MPTVMTVVSGGVIAVVSGAVNGPRTDASTGRRRRDRHDRDGCEAAK